MFPCFSYDFDTISSTSDSQKPADHSALVLACHSVNTICWRIFRDRKRRKSAGNGIRTHADQQVHRLSLSLKACALSTLPTGNETTRLTLSRHDWSRLTRQSLTNSHHLKMFAWSAHTSANWSAYSEQESWPMKKKAEIRHSQQRWMDSRKGELRENSPEPIAGLLKCLHSLRSERVRRFND